MNTYTEVQENPSADTEAPEARVVKSSKRGRPKVSVQWPEGEFTFDSLQKSNVLSASSLRKKMRVELVKGGVLKVNTLKTAFGRPLSVYKKTI